MESAACCLVRGRVTASTRVLAWASGVSERCVRACVLLRELSPKRGNECV